MEDYKLAARYAFMPNRLKYCGPQDSDQILHDYVCGEENLQPLVKDIMKQFHALVIYLDLIKKDKNIFDKEVLESYWIGNNLIENINTNEIKNIILNDFTKKGLPVSSAQELAESVPKNAIPHHSFHVFHIHSISGKVQPTMQNLDKCRIGAGKVIDIKNGNMLVEYKPIIFKDKLKYGPLIKKQIIHNKAFTPNLKIGEFVAMHWDFAVDKLTQKQVNTLEKYTDHNMNAMNSK